MLPNRLFFFTASIYDWIPILQNDGLKNIILESLKHLVDENAIKLSAFVIMPNHIHLLIMPLCNPKYQNVQLSLMRFTAQKIKFHLLDHNDPIIDRFLVNKKDRTYQIWQRNPLATELYSRSVVEQKLDYIHRNPVQGKWNLATSDMDYEYSSIKFYEEDEKNFSCLTHYMDLI